MVRGKAVLKEVVVTAQSENDLLILLRDVVKQPEGLFYTPSIDVCVCRDISFFHRNTCTLKGP